MSEADNQNPFENEDDSFFMEQKQQDHEKQKEQEKQEPIKTKPYRIKKVKRIRKTEKNNKKTRPTKQKQRQEQLYKVAERKAEEIIEEMNKKYEQDIQLYNKKQLACKKYKYIDTLSHDLKNIYICDKFLELNGLQMFEKWLSKMAGKDGAEGIEPSLSIRKALFEILLFLNAKSEHIVKAQELQRLIQKHKKSQIKELRDLSEQIISKWSRLTYEDNE